MEIRNRIYKDGSNICSIDGLNEMGFCKLPFDKQRGKYTNYVFLKNSKDPIYKNGLYFWDTSDLCNCMFDTINGKDYVFVASDNLFIVKGEQ